MTKMKVERTKENEGNKWTKRREKREKEYANIFLYFNKMKHFSRVHIFCMQELTTHRVKVTVLPNIPRSSKKCLGQWKPQF